LQEASQFADLCDFSGLLASVIEQSAYLLDEPSLVVVCFFALRDFLLLVELSQRQTEV
jgi:hypothetical protein